jgi:predicted anti-sigma-YlaC factor YlaD
MILAGRISIIVLLCASLTACSIRQMAIKSIADSLSSGSNIFSTDDDPEFVRDAIPFGLKMYESLLEKQPEHKGLLLATARGFTQYTYAFVQFEADLVEDSDLIASRKLRKRAQLLYLRARDYAIRGLEVDHPDFMSTLRVDTPSALKSMTKKDVPLLYWAGVSWSAAIATSKDNLDLLSELNIVEKIMGHALRLDEAFNVGALHEFYIAFDGSRSAAMGGSIKRARQHFNRVIELTNGKKASPYVSLAENISVNEQNADEFRKLLKMALSINVNDEPAYRLENIISQRRAAWLLAHIEDLFLDTGESIYQGHNLTDRIE